jgi:DNA-binding CsgD family transcriptional regulator
MQFTTRISKINLLLSLSIVTLSVVFIVSVFYAQPIHRYVQINYINSLLIVLFLVLTLSFGIGLGRSKVVHKPLHIRESGLSFREQEIVQLIINGKKNIEIANALFVELSTIKCHINNIYKKENVRNRHEIKEKYRQFSQQHLN